MPAKIDGRQIAVYLTDEQLRKMDRIAGRHGITRARVTRMLLDIGLDTYETYEMVGVPQLAEVVVRFREKLKEVSSSKQLRLF